VVDTSVYESTIMAEDCRYSLPCHVAYQMVCWFGIHVSHDLGKLASLGQEENQLGDGERF
jgi:hypothetical protein